MSIDRWPQVLVHIDPDGRADARLRLAARIAGAHHASLSVLYACNPATTMVPMGDGALMSERLPDLDAVRRRQTREAFERWLAQGHHAGWEEHVGFDLVHAVARRAMAADLAILGQSLTLPGTASVPPELPEDVLLRSGRPALLVPAVGDLPALDVAVVAWKATPESVRATTAALPLLQDARRVVLLAFGGDPAACQGASEHLKMHGVDAEVCHEPAEPSDVGEAVLSRLSDLGAGLLVMGCYGHVRLQERLFGGMTRTILRSMTTPVFMMG